MPRLFSGLLLFFSLLAPSWASEGRVTSADLSEIRGVITRQIDAFRRDDAKGAFALVSPEAQQAFRTAERFLQIVRSAYRAVYRPSRISFLDLMVIGDEVVQQVRLTDTAGAVWIAYYAMQRQPDGSWRANGYHVVQPSRTIPALLRFED